MAGTTATLGDARRGGGGASAAAEAGAGRVAREVISEVISEAGRVAREVIALRATAAASRLEGPAQVRGDE